MAKDFINGKRTHFGNKRSHALNSTRRAWKPNLQKVRILVDGKPKKVWVSARTLKSGKVTRVQVKLKPTYKIKDVIQMVI